MSDVFIWIYSGGGGVKFMKHFEGGASYKSLGISDVPCNSATAGINFSGCMCMFIIKLDLWCVHVSLIYILFTIYLTTLSVNMTTQRQVIERYMKTAL
jgi:hypothetical protein